MYKKILSEPKNIVIFSGGEGVSDLSKKLKYTNHHVSYIVPISDNGGSSWEIIKHFGGPAIGDIRKRLTDISGDESPEGQAVHQLLTFRTDKNDQNLAEKQWADILWERSDLWQNISAGYKYWILADLVYFDGQLKLQAKNYDFRNMSIGNGFFSGARMRMNSLEAAIFNFSRVAMIKNTEVIPIIDTNKTLTIGCELENGDRILGQRYISYRDGIVNKNEDTSLSAKIKQVFYLNDDHQEYKPQVNPHVLKNISEADLLVYAMGSFWTSIVPCLILDGVAENIINQKIPKVFILNGYPDRETYNMQAEDFILAVQKNLNNNSFARPVNDYISDLIYLKESPLAANINFVKKYGLRTKYLRQMAGTQKNIYNTEELIENILSFLK